MGSFYSAGSNHAFSLDKIRKLSHLQIIALGFMLTILIGTMLLMLPFASESGKSTPFFDCLFTATSATCVTGLVVVDTATHWSLFGEIVILLMIQIGGLGFMTIATLFFFVMRKKVGLREREIMVESINTTQVGGIMRLTKKILHRVAIFEGAGAILLAIRFVPQFGITQGLYYSVFHSISAFCNAGFDLMGTPFGAYSSLVPYSNDILVNLTVCALITIGGLGFIVWDDLANNGFRFKKYKLHTKLVIVSSFILIVGGALLMFLFERNMQNGITENVLNALFGSVTARTAGFNTTDTGAMSNAGKLLTISLMFIGGSPGSTAGGIKTTTVMVILMYAVAQMRRNRYTGMFGRSIDTSVVTKALTIAATNLALAFMGTLIICAEQPEISLADSLFEAFSAIGTVGMTTGITRDLSLLSRLVVIFMMFCGRVGSVSFALALLEKRARPQVVCPRENVTVG